MMTDEKSRADADARELIAMSRRIGADPNLVQAGGGNTSVKSIDGETMYVKASGTALADMQPGGGYRRIRLGDAIEMLLDPELMRLPATEREKHVLARLTGATVDSLDGRPSVESSLHAFLGRAVAHTHPAVANGLCCTRHGLDLAREWFGKSFGDPLFVPYVDPGLPLARSTYRKVRAYEREHGTLPALIFLANHGVFVSAETAAKAIRITERVQAVTRRNWRRCGKPPRGEHAVPSQGLPDNRRRRIRATMRRVWSKIMSSEKLTVRYAAGPEVEEALAHPDVAALMRIGPLTPDHVVYAHGQPVWLGASDGAVDLEAEMASALDSALKKLPGVPRALLVPRAGLFVAGADRAAAESALAITRASLRTLLVATALGGCRGLTRRAVEYIEGWEVERFRRGMVRK